MLWFCMFLTILILLFSPETMHAAQQAAQVFTGNVMPALFPMMVLGSLIAAWLPVRRTRTATFVSQIMFGFCAGSPASTRQLTALDQQESLPRRTYGLLLCMSGVMSPMFFTGTLASRTGRHAAWLMLICHWGSALLTGALYHCLYKSQSQGRSPDRPTRKGDEPVRFQHSTPAPGRPAFAASLTSAISNAAHAQLAVLGAMIAFSILAALMQTVLGRLFPAWTSRHASWLAIGWSLMEIGGGVIALLDCDPSAPLWLICALCSFGGLSIWLQNLLFLDPKIHPAELLGFRTLHGVLAGILCSLVFHLAGGKTAETAALPHPAAAFPNTGAFPWLPLLLVVTLACYPLHHRQKA